MLFFSNKYDEIYSHISGVTLLGVPAEVYDHGTQYLTICSTFLLIIYVTNEVYIPVFYPLQLNSIYEVSRKYRLILKNLKILNNVNQTKLLFHTF